MLEVTLRPAGPADETFLDRLYADVHAEEFAPLDLAPPALAQLLTMQARMQRASYARTFPAAIDRVVLYGAEPVGRLMTVDLPGETHLIDIALLRTSQRQAVGTGLIEQLCLQARQNAKPLTLSVRVDNPARRLYQRLGFIAAGSDGMNLWLRYTGESQPEPQP
jgi:ribosomal protein S18 acetylase RimI-like enzyme